MECPHLQQIAKITSPTCKENPTSQWSCSVCKSTKSLWICLACGVVNCGRYENGHAKAHMEDAKAHMEDENHHCVCLDCNELSVFCYNCDEFVINDTKEGHLEKLRTNLQLMRNQQHSRRSSTESNENEKKKLKTDRGSKTSQPKSSGLRNLGNTCFMNAVLQSLSNIHEFCGYIKQMPSLEKRIPVRKVKVHTRCSNVDDVFVVEELRKTLVALWQGSKSAISPDSLFSVIWKVVPRFRGYQQQDAHEFMRYLLDRLHTELLTLLPYPSSTSAYIGPKGKSSIVTTIFGGILQNEVNCLICGSESKKHDPFLDLSLDIPATFTSKTRKPKDGETVCELSDCLASFTELEHLEESELYRCERCKKKQPSTKKFWIRRLPNVLCLHLKRFRWQNHFRCKVETYVDFPLKGLDMSKFVLNNMHGTRNTAGCYEYDLAAAIVHHGTGAGSGHYTSFAIHDEQWFHFNDSNVSTCDVDRVAACHAYILFYVRRELKLPDYVQSPDFSILQA